MADTQISAHISQETKQLIERYADAHGVKRGALVEQALLHHLPALRELPADFIIALAWHLREDMDFDDDVADLRERWRGLFGSITPFRGRSLDGYLSNYIVSK